MWSFLISVALPILKKHSKIVIILATVGAGGVYIWWLNDTINDWERDYEVLEDDYDDLEAEHAALNDTLDSQNKKIGELQEITDEKDKLVQEKLQEKQQELQQKERELEQILAEKPAETCEKSFNYLADGIEDLKW